MYHSLLSTGGQVPMVILAVIVKYIIYPATSQ